MQIVCNTSWRLDKSKGNDNAVCRSNGVEEPSNHSSDCYFCLTPPVASGMNRKKKQRIDYPNIPSAIRPVPHGEDLLVPEPPKEYNLNSVMEEEDTRKAEPLEEEPTVPDFQCPSSESPNKLTQIELNDVVRDLEL